jgi:integrase
MPFDHRPMQYLDHAEVRGLLEAVDTSSKGGVRDRALLLTLYNTGARVKEIVDLTIDDLRLEPPSQVRSGSSSSIARPRDGDWMGARTSPTRFLGTSTTTAGWTWWCRTAAKGPASRRGPSSS